MLNRRICIIWAVSLFLGGPLAYLPVAKRIIIFNLSYVRIRRVDGRKGNTWGDRGGKGDVRCYFFNIPFFAVFVSNPLSPPYNIASHLLSAMGSSFLLMSRILNLAATAEK